MTDGFGEEEDLSLRRFEIGERTTKNLRNEQELIVGQRAIAGFESAEGAHFDVPSASLKAEAELKLG